MSDDRSLETIKDYRHLDIVVEGQISLSPSNTILELVEGDMADLLCSVEEGFPKPDISWGVDRELWGVLDTGKQVGTLLKSLVVVSGRYCTVQQEVSGRYRTAL